MHYHREQKEKGKAAAQLHTLAAVLQVLLNASLDALGTPNAKLSSEQLLEECRQSLEDLRTMLLKFFGRHIVQPRCGTFKKATGVAHLSHHP